MRDPIRPSTHLRAAVTVSTELFSAAANGLVRTLLAPGCAACGEVLETPLAGPVCGACWRAVSRLTPPVCALCGDALPSSSGDSRCRRCRRIAPVFSIARSGGRYDGELRAIVHAFKYEGRRVLARPLARVMCESSADVLTGADAVVPVPLHPRRAWQRGFNQADDLARETGLPVWRMLRRRRHGPPQVQLPAARRHANVRHAYERAWSVRLFPWMRGRLRGSVIVLVDDVMTTGATLNACAGVLLRAGAREVRALTVARAVTTRPLPPNATLHLSTARHR